VKITTDILGLKKAKQGQAGVMLISVITWQETCSTVSNIGKHKRMTAASEPGMNPESNAYQSLAGLLGLW